jgi:hypothetical protein
MVRIYGRRAMIGSGFIDEEPLEGQGSREWISIHDELE